jgi:hypothetical protein
VTTPLTRGGGHRRRSSLRLARPGRSAPCGR